jgi:DNA-binding CsgD family transcriptional regulator
MFQKEVRMEMDRQSIELLDNIYGAATDPTRWADVLASLAQSWSAGVAALTAYDKRRSRGQIQVMVGLTDEQSQAYNSHYGAIDDLWQASRRLQTVGVIVHRDDLVPFDKFRHTEFYNDYLSPHGLQEQMGCLLHRDEHSETALTFCRNSRLRSFGMQEERLLRILMPHVQRSVSLHHQLMDSEEIRAGLQSALDLVSAGVLVLNRMGRILVMNVAAERICERRDGLSVSQSHLVGNTVAVTRKLEASIAEVLGTQAGRGTVSLLVPRPSPKAPLRLVVYANPEVLRYCHAPSSAAIVIFVTDTDRPPQLSTDNVKSLFGLTPAEARLVEHIASGRTLREAAELLQVTYPTVRAQLASVFAKMGISRQSQLVSLIYSSPAIFGWSR